ncbi:hypothetical protein EDC01DRAFT_630704 [Geopyxis carbonaria]|nr:hypothetical protein EDC01DRAFT_630704 [Geopyxis carbonaria]
MDAGSLSQGTPETTVRSNCCVVDTSQDNTPEGQSSPCIERRTTCIAVSPGISTLPSLKAGFDLCIAEFNVRLKKVELLQLHADLHIQRQKLVELGGSKVWFFWLGRYSRMYHARAHVALAQKLCQEKQEELAEWENAVKAAETQLVDTNREMLFSTSSRDSVH